MSYQDLAVDEFLSRIRHLPDSEAKEQIVMRKDRNLLEMGVVTAERSRLAGNPKSKKEFEALGREHFVMCQDNGRLEEARKEVVARMERVNWATAVKTVLGQEAYDRCRLWMIQQTPDGEPVDTEKLRYLMAKYGLGESAPC